MTKHEPGSDARSSYLESIARDDGQTWPERREEQSPGRVGIGVRCENLVRLGLDDIIFFGKEAST